MILLFMITFTINNLLWLGDTGNIKSTLVMKFKPTFDFDLQHS